MKKTIKSLVVASMLFITLALPNQVKADTNITANFMFEGNVRNVGGHHVVPDNEVWRTQDENMNVNAYVSFTGINEDDIENYKIKSVTTNNPKEVTMVGAYGDLDYALMDASFNCNATIKKDTTLSFTIVMEHDGQLYTFTSPVVTYKLKKIDTLVKEGKEGIYSRTELANLPNATELKLNQNYYFLPSIEGHTIDEIDYNTRFYIDEKSLDKQIITTDQYTCFGINVSQLTRGAVGVVTNSAVSFKANKPVQIKLNQQAVGFIGLGGEVFNYQNLGKTLQFSDPVDHKDTATKVEIAAGAGVLPDHTSLEVKQIENNKSVEAALKDIAQRYEAYDISILKDNASIQPNGLVTVKIPLSPMYTGRTMNVYYIDDNGNVTLMPSKVENGYIIFEATHFSVYAVVEEKEKVVEPEEKPVTPDKQPDTTPDNNTGTQPKDTLAGTTTPKETAKDKDIVKNTATDHTMQGVAIACIGVCIISGAILSILRKKKELHR